MSILNDIEAKLGQWLASPDTLRAISTGLRRHSPILVVGERAIVTRHADVLEVLRNDRDFGVTEIYAARMERTTGAFALGMEDGEQYRREAGFIRAAVRADDLELVRGLVDASCDALLQRVRSSGHIDAVAQFTHVIPIVLLQEYFGLVGPESPTLARWMRTIFWEIFLNFSDIEEVRESAAHSSVELASCLRELIAQRKQELAEQRLQRDDFLSRLVRLQAEHGADDECIRRSFGGVIVGSVDTQSKAMCNALDQLLRHPEALQAAEAAAREGNEALLSEYVWEALRFNPHNPILTRHCRNGATLAKGTERETQIPPGTTVYAVTLSAMFDEAVFEHPEEFRIGRPRESYIHFGFGQHRCFGEPFNRVVVPRALMHLLRLPRLRIGMGGWSRIQFEGPFPQSFPLEFG
ncbi:MAG: cytochrome P450 [Myxococcota bacterium]